MKTIRFLGGHLGYLLAVIIKIFRFKEYTYTIATANESWQDKFLVVMVVNSSRAGGGFLIAPEASITDGLLNMVLCKKMPILKRLRYLPIMKKGKHTHLPFVLMRELKAVTILPSKTVAVQIDGELHYADRINIAVLKEKFLFRY
jgi:diacylglycerol kinase (ATP)